MKKLISVLCVVLVVFCAMNVFENKSQALFVVDDATAVMIITSVIAGIALSEGIALATGSESVYTGMANAIWDYFVQGEAAGDVQEALEKMQLYGSFTIQAGKAYFALNQNGYNFFRSWLSGIDWNDIRMSSNLVISNNDFIMIGSGGGALENYRGHYSVGLVGSPMTFTTPTYSVSVVSNGSTGTLQVVLSGDGTAFTRHFNMSNFTSSTWVLFQSNRDGQIFVLGGGMSQNGHTVAADSLERTTQCSGNFGSAVISWDNNSPHDYDTCSAGSLNYTWLSNGYKVSLNDTVIYQSNYRHYYGISTLGAGCLLSNVSNNVVTPNTNSDVNVIEKPIQVQEVAKALPGNTGLGRNQNMLIPVPGNFVDSNDSTQVLSPSQVREYQDDETRDFTFVPMPSGYMGETGATMGITIVNNTDVEPVDLPTYSPGYPVGVIPTDTPADITVTAGGDVFTTAPAGEATTAGTLEGDVADIKDEIGDISAPLTPGDAQKGANKLRLPSLLVSKFPFCIPFDLYNGINQFSAEAEMPSFDIPFRIASLDFNYTIHIDFERFITLAKVCQWFFSVSWVIILIMLTRKVIWK